MAYTAGGDIAKDSVWVNEKRVSPPIFYAVWDVRFSPDSRTVAYGAVGLGRDAKSSIWINEKRISPEFDSVRFAWQHYNKTNKIIFAGYDKERCEILHAEAR